MKRRAFFIVGLEGSGTYMLAEAFVAAGCTYCDKDDVKAFLKEQQPEELVLRRSFPHAGHMPCIACIDRILKQNKYAVYYYLIIRDEDSAIRSAQRRGSTTFKDGGEMYHNAKRFIGDILMGYPCRIVTYECFVRYPEMRRNLFENHDFESPDMEFYDGNAKYYD